jgi:hypothetical protein
VLSSSSERCERRLQLTRAECIDAEQSERAAAIRQLAFDFNDGARNGDARHGGDARIEILIQAGSTLDRQVGKSIKAARGQRHFVGRGAIDQVDGETERDAQCDRNHEQRIATRRAPQRSGESGIDERPRCHVQLARSASPWCVRR